MEPDLDTRRLSRLPARGGDIDGAVAFQCLLHFLIHDKILFGSYIQIPNSAKSLAELTHRLGAVALYSFEECLPIHIAVIQPLHVKGGQSLSLLSPLAYIQEIR